MRTIATLMTGVLLAATGCQDRVTRELETKRPVLVPVKLSELDMSAGQTLYVPAYSAIYSTGKQPAELSVTLSVRNTDLDHAIVLRSVRYYDGKGELVEEFVPEAVELPPMGSTEFVITHRDRRGGVGANFIVEWGAGEKVSEPVVEAIMIGTSGTKGLSWSSQARVLHGSP